MSNERTCPRCGTALAPDALEGLCPTCLGRAVFDNDLAIDGTVDDIEATLSPEIESEALRLKPEEAGEWIGPYKLMEMIGQGGFGTVWVADQERPVRRRVALKIIKLGMDTKEVIARFEQERQALAMMDHPHIAKVLDAGATEWGRPYFVMELVRGIIITDYCDQANLSTDERLVLFTHVCQAVQHAHQKGIIHRDLKPSNILVTLHDGVPVPKVIDFGIAKATQTQRLTDLTIYTQFQQMIGSPLYMSPEQVEMSGLDIDTRSDIYSLGVLLYELLTGRTPFDPEELMQKGIDEIRRTIREMEPPTPSLFLKTMAEATRATVAQHRQADPAKLTKLVRGDLDWIVMKALEKDRSRRYETANGLAMDIQRHLNNEPVLARPPSHLYRLRRLVRRNRVVFAAAAAVVAALVAGLSVAIHSYFNERVARAGEAQQRQIAEGEKRQAQASAKEATASELKAKRFLYAADMNLVQQALRSNNIGRARQLLDRHRPAGGDVDLRSWEWRYLWQQCRSGALAMITKRAGVRAFSTSFSPDGAWLAVGFFDGQVELWDVAKRKLAKVVQEPFDHRGHVAFSPRGGFLAATMGRGVVKVYNVATGTATEVCRVGDYICDLSYSADGEWLVVLSAGPDLVQVLRATDGVPVMIYPLPNGNGMHFNNARLSPDKKRLYVSCGAFVEPNVRCVSVPDAQLHWEIADGQIDGGGDEDVGKDVGFSAMDLSPDGHTLAVATGYSRHSVRILDTRTGQLKKKLQGHTGWVCDLAFSKDGKWVASASSDQTLRLWDTSTWNPQADPLRGHSQEVHAVAFTNDGRLLASGSKDGVVLMWDTVAQRPENGGEHLPSHIQRAIALPIGQTVLGRTADGIWSAINLIGLKEEVLPLSEISGEGGLPRIYPEARRLPVGPKDLSQLGLRGVLSRPALSPDGRLLAVASEDGFVGLYNAKTLAPVEILRGNMGTVFSVAFSPDNQRLALASGGSQGVDIWDVETRQALITLPGANMLLYYVEFTGDGDTLLVGSNAPPRNLGQSCQYWRAPSWTELNEAERAGGLWPQTEAFRPPPPAVTVPQLKSLLEQEYRKRLALSVEQTSGNPGLRDGSLANLAHLLHQHGRDAEAEPLLRELLQNVRQRNPGDDQAALFPAQSLLSAILALVQSERGSGDTAKPSERTREADDLVNEILGTLAQSLVVEDRDTIPPLRVTALQAWFSRDADHLNMCRRLIETAEKKEDDGYREERAARSLCFNSASDPALLARALRLARHAAELEKHEWQRGWYQQTLGLAEFRSGNDAAAEQAMLRAIELAEQSSNWNPKLRPFIEGPARLVRSMILFRRGEVADARKLFAEAEAQMKPLPNDAREVLVNGANQDDLLFWLAYKEAKALLQL